MPVLIATKGRFGEPEEARAATRKTRKEKPTPLFRRYLRNQDTLQVPSLPCSYRWTLAHARDPLLALTEASVRLYAHARVRVRAHP